MSHTHTVRVDFDTEDNPIRIEVVTIGGKTLALANIRCIRVGVSTIGDMVEYAADETLLARINAPMVEIAKEDGTMGP